jgi:hypothetical protein
MKLNRLTRSLLRLCETLKTFLHGVRFWQSSAARRLFGPARCREQHAMNQRAALLCLSQIQGRIAAKGDRGSDSGSAIPNANPEGAQAPSLAAAAAAAGSGSECPKALPTGAGAPGPKSAAGSGADPHASPALSEPNLGRLWSSVCLRRDHRQAEPARAAGDEIAQSLAATFRRLLQEGRTVFSPAALSRLANSCVFLRGDAAQAPDTADLQGDHDDALAWLALPTAPNPYAAGIQKRAAWMLSVLGEGHTPAS